MTTNVPPRVLILDYLKEHGPTKVSVLTKVAKIGETTTRKVLRLLEANHEVVKHGALWEIKTTEADRVVAKKAHRSRATDAPTPSGRRAAAIERDGEVCNTLAASGPQTRNEVAERFGIKPSEAYLSLFRLRKAGLVVKEGEHWKAVAS